MSPTLFKEEVKRFKRFRLFFSPRISKICIRMYTSFLLSTFRNHLSYSGMRSGKKGVGESRCKVLSDRLSWRINTVDDFQVLENQYGTSVMSSRSTPWIPQIKSNEVSSGVIHFFNKREYVDYNYKLLLYSYTIGVFCENKPFSLNSVRRLWPQFRKDFEASSMKLPRIKELIQD